MVCPSGCGGSQVNKFLYVPIQPQLKKKLEGKCVCVCVDACVCTCMHAILARLFWLESESDPQEAQKP